MTRRRIYSPRDRADALTVVANCDGSVARAAKALDIPRRTLRHWVGREPLAVLVPGVPEKPEGGLVDEAVTRWKRVRDLGLREAEKGLAESRVAPRDAAWISAVSQDKINVLEGRPDSRTELVSLADFLRHAPAKGTQGSTLLPPAMSSAAFAGGPDDERRN